MDDDHPLDVRGRPCPVPILELAKLLSRLASGETVALRGTDPAIPKDLEAFCASTGHGLLSVEQGDGEIRARLRRA